ncbi:MAG: hypothetical protein IK067_04730 [Prevotella sp.]|nr:hypothetical protein [Prevotella sp.]
MKKYIEISEEALARLVLGKCVKGSLHRDKWTGKVTFLAYNCQPRTRLKDLLVKKLPWGWVKESPLRIKRYTSIPNDLSLPEKLAIFDVENEVARNALVERELDLIEF